MLNDIELNVILFYADFLSLQEISIPVTDNCKYFFVHGTPINSAYILDLEPIYDETNKYFQQAKAEYSILKDKFGEDGAESFIDDICVISQRGSVNAEQMLQCIHHFSSKKERNKALNEYQNWKNNQIYTHTVINEDGKETEKRCSKYVYHTERMLERRGILKSAGYHPKRYENTTQEPLV